jgi:ubiquinone/menaquinone biosynthesis C-methylase UbiE
MEQKDTGYIISGGTEGKTRLNVLSDVLKDDTSSLIEQTGPVTGKKFLDLGCGGGNVSLMVAKMVGETGHVTAIDFDEKIIALAQKDATEQKIHNISFEAKSAYDISFSNEFDIVYSRFLLSHLKDPKLVLQNMLKSAKPGGSIIVEDVQFSGHFCFPQCDAFNSYLEYYSAAAFNNNQNPEIGLSLFQLFHDAGIEQISVDVIQPCFSSGPGKWMGYITMDKIKNMVIKQGLADAAKVDKLLMQLEAFTKDEQTVISLPRIFRVRGVKA